MKNNNVKILRSQFWTLELKKFVLIKRYISTNLVEQKYINNQVLKNVNKNIIIVSKNIDEITINKYLKQYNNITFINNDIFHDRFIIIDNKELYNIGSSLKDIGKKCSSVNKIEDTVIISELIDRLKLIYGWNSIFTIVYLSAIIMVSL